MSIREEQCNKVCRILDDVLANRPTERDSLIVAVRKAFKALEVFGNSEQLPAAQPDYQEVLGWLLAYHTMSFDLHGRYLPHEVISWLINDFTKEFIAERGQNG